MSKIKLVLKLIVIGFLFFPKIVNASCFIDVDGKLTASANNDVCTNPLGSILTGNGAFYTYQNNVTLNNIGESESVYMFGDSTILNNTGLIYSPALQYGVNVTVTGYNATINNSGTIHASQVGAIWVQTGHSVIAIDNSGTIYSDTSIGVVNRGTIASITNIGSIYGLVGIQNNGSITIINNSQGVGNINGALSLSENLPTNYNIIINSASSYGQLSGSSFTGATSFGIYNSSTITSKLYSAVLQGLTTSNVGATRSGTYNGLNWTLALQNGSTTVWDLIFTGGSTVDTQSSLNALASKLRGAFSGQAMVTNFANMNTYDCNLFDAKGLCVSVGGQQTYVDSPSANMTSAVVVAGYKVSPTLRVGGFLNQNVNSNTGSNVDISNNSPLMGLFAVWNKNENHLGYQVKIANAYQDMDVTTTRDVIGTSEAGKGKTDLNTQSYVGELSYAFLTNEDKTLVRPYAALRYTRIKQDGYTERTTTAVTAPLTYAALSDRSTAALVGVKLNHKLTDKVNLTGSLGVEQDLNHDVDNLTASGVSGLTSENFNNNINRTRPVASIGAYYMPVKNQRIAADIYYQELPFRSTASTTAYVNYMIGF